jgi:hypothetical protein
MPGAAEEVTTAGLADGDPLGGIEGVGLAAGTAGAADDSGTGNA